ERRARSRRPRGASPRRGPRTRGGLYASRLRQAPRLPMAEVALASGFGSLRRFNEVFRELFGRPPSALRRKARAADSAREGVTLRLAYRPPYDWPGMLAALSSRTVPGVERIDKGAWHRRIGLDGKQGSEAVSHLPAP